MVQEVIALTIVFAAAAYTVYSIVKSVKKKESPDCSSSCKCSKKKGLNS